ncbi:hypothetical protein HanLR1_Chr17g0661421 [Helianthus annuus]|nr:hypothetical protein HanHA89_Chr17g0702671 [Helianthus annuus]KAJ0632113.1 hypothetical protein HanLR1_Chr17g0661421 [Helianthus annuus]
MMNNSWRLNKLGEAWSESGSNESSIEEKRSSDARCMLRARMKIKRQAQ